MILLQAACFSLHVGWNDGELTKREFFNRFPVWFWCCFCSPTFSCFTLPFVWCFPWDRMNFETCMGDSNVARASLDVFSTTPTSLKPVTPNIISFTSVSTSATAWSMKLLITTTDLSMSSMSALFGMFHVEMCACSSLATRSSSCCRVSFSLSKACCKWNNFSSIFCDNLCSSSCIPFEFFSRMTTRKAAIVAGHISTFDTGSYISVVKTVGANSEVCAFDLASASLSGLPSGAGLLTALDAYTSMSLSTNFMNPFSKSELRSPQFAFNFLIQPVFLLICIFCIFPKLSNLAFFGFQLGTRLLCHHFSLFVLMLWQRHGIHPPEPQTFWSANTLNQAYDQFDQMIKVNNGPNAILIATSAMYTTVCWHVIFFYARSRGVEASLKF